MTWRWAAQPGRTDRQWHNGQHYVHAYACFAVSFSSFYNLHSPHVTSLGVFSSRAWLCGANI